MATKKSTKKSKSLSTADKVGIGVGLTTAAVAAAGAYFLYGSKDAKKNRAKVKSWMLKAKAEVLETLEKAEEMTKAEYEEVIETVAKSYGTLKDASKADINNFRKEMKEHWPKIEKEGKQAIAVVEKTVQKFAKKAPTKAKKTANKAAKKTKKTAKKATKKAAKK